MKKICKYLETNTTLHLFTIAILTTIAYSNSLYNSFHFDDRYAILEDIAIQKISNLPLILSDILNRPLLRATFAINYFFNGMDVFGYHLVNLLFHITVSVQVYFLASILYKRFLINGNNPQTFALLSALIFALHPLHTGSVTYIASRSAVLTAMFYLAAFLLFLRALSAEGHKKYLFYFFAYMFFILSFGVKEIVVTLPLIIAVYAFIMHKDGFAAYFKKYGILLSLWFVILFLYILARHLMLTETVPLDTRIEEGILPRYSYLLTEMKVIIFYYLRWLIFPFGGPHVDPDIPAETTIFSSATIGAMVIMISLISLSFLSKKRWPMLSFGIFWYFITLLPTSSIFPIGDVAVERHVYIPAIGFSLVFGYLLERAEDKLPLKVILPLSAALFAVFLYLTVAGNSIWKNELTLWDDAAKKAPNKIRALNNRAWGYYLAGDLNSAELYYKELLARYPEYPFGHNNLGLIYQTKGNLEYAIQEYERAVAIRPGNQIFRMNLGIAYDRAGLFDKAAGELETAAIINPMNPQALIALGATLSKKRDFRRSIQIVSKAIEIDSENAMAYYILGYSYEMSGLFTEAFNAYNNALKFNPDWELPKIRISGMREKR